MARANENKILGRLQKIEKRMAELEGQLASSWAMHTRSEYEEQLKENITNKILKQATTIVITGLIFLGGAGYVVMKSAFVDVYRAENKRVISEMTEEYERFVKRDERRFEWKKQHDYGKNYVYLAEFYSNSGLAADTVRKPTTIALERAKTYFNLALNADAKQPTTHWELGELNYTYPKNYNVPSMINIHDAISHYKDAIKLYPGPDISKGWRADPYRTIAKIYVDSVDANENVFDPWEVLPEALDLLTKARSDYQNVVPESRGYNKERLEEVERYLLTANDLFKKLKKK